MRIMAPIIVALFIASFVFAQKPAPAPDAVAARLVVKKQQIVDDTEIQLREVQYAFVRGYVRHKLAQWLWKNGRDDSGRAEMIAVKALDEIYARRNELSESQHYRLSTDLFALLDSNAKETSERLKKKYAFGSEDYVLGVFDDLKKPNGDQLAAARLIQVLNKPGDTPLLVNAAIHAMITRRSPQLPAVLDAFLTAHESGRATTPVSSLRVFMVSFENPAVPRPLRARFFALAIARTRGLVQKAPPENLLAHGMLDAAIKSFGDDAPDLVPEAMGLRSAFGLGGSEKIKEMDEAEERIAAAEDKIAALIAEAERTDIAIFKWSFYSRAEKLAKQQARLELALDLIERAGAANKAEYLKDWPDQEYEDVAKIALDKDLVEIAIVAINKIGSGIKQASLWRSAAQYFGKTNNAEGAAEAIHKALVLLEGEPAGLDRTRGIIETLAPLQKFNKSIMPHGTTLAAKAINDLPTPGPDDKPGSPNYNTYINGLWTVNNDLGTAIKTLHSKDRSDASDLAERIMKKEVRVAADLYMAMYDFDATRKDAQHR